MASYLRIIAIALGLALALGVVPLAFGIGPRYQLITLGGRRGEGGETFTLQLANTTELQDRGLRGRSSLAVDGGMLVLLDKPRTLVYSTRRTPFPVDVLYITADGTVLKVDHLKADDDNLAGSTSGQPVAGAVLLPGGTAARLHLRVGSGLPVIPPPRERREERTEHDQ